MKTIAFVLLLKMTALSAAELFVVDFSEGLKANYARGNPILSGNGEWVVGREGGAALRIVPGRIEPSHLLQSPVFRMVRFPVQDNISRKSGTLEMWIKPEFSRTHPVSYVDPLNQPDDIGWDRYFLFHMAISPGNRQIGLYLRRQPDTHQVDLVWHEMIARDEASEADEPNTRNVFMRAEASALLEKGWHHIRVSWNGGERKMWINENEVATAELPFNLPEFGGVVRPAAIGSLATYSDLPAHASIDFFKIRADAHNAGTAKQKSMAK